MKAFILITAVAVVGISERTAAQGQGKMGMMHNNVKVCTADTPGSQWVRRGIYLREKGDCQQGFMCDNKEIKPFMDPCPDGTFFDVHTGVCAYPNVYDYVYTSFNCSAENDDPLLNYDNYLARRDQNCRPLMEGSDIRTKDLYVGDPENCRLMYKCPNVADHDDWFTLCPLGMRFAGIGEEWPCVPDEDNCAARAR